MLQSYAYLQYIPSVLLKIFFIFVRLNEKHMQTFEVTKDGVTHTFIGDRAQAYQNYWEDEMAKNNYSFLEYCMETCEVVTDSAASSAPAGPDHILTEEYLTSLGFIKTRGTGNSGYYTRVDETAGTGGVTFSSIPRYQFLEFTQGGSWYNQSANTFIKISHQYGTSSQATVFFGVVKDRQTFEIILNAVS